MKRYLFFSAIKEIDLPNINPFSEGYQRALDDLKENARKEILSLPDSWIINYNGEDDV